MKLILAALLTVLALDSALAVEPGEMLKDPAQEARAREVGKGLRCVVCQNQSIDDSNAELARDMRILVRDRIKAGDTNQQVLDYMVSRYGDFVLLEPPVKGTTYALWFGPIVIVALGIVAVVAFFRRRQRLAAAGGDEDGPAPVETPAPLSDKEKKRLAALMEDSEQ